GWNPELALAFALSAVAREAVEAAARAGFALRAAAVHLPVFVDVAGAAGGGFRGAGGGKGRRGQERRPHRRGAGIPQRQQRQPDQPSASKRHAGSVYHRGTIRRVIRHWRAYGSWSRRLTRTWSLPAAWMNWWRSSAIPTWLIRSGSRPVAKK